MIVETPHQTVCWFQPYCGLTIQWDSCTLVEDKVVSVVVVLVCCPPPGVPFGAFLVSGVPFDAFLVSGFPGPAQRLLWCLRLQR